MAKPARNQWVDVYQSEVPGHARLIATILDTLGVQAKLERKPGRESNGRVPHVRVNRQQAEQAKTLLAAYQLES